MVFYFFGEVMQRSFLVYMRRLESMVSDGNEHRDAWIESLRSFAQFLRDDMDELIPKGHLEVLFPSKEGSKGMERYGKAIRTKK